MRALLRRAGLAGAGPPEARSSPGPSSPTSSTISRGGGPSFRFPARSAVASSSKALAAAAIGEVVAILVRHGLGSLARELRLRRLGGVQVVPLERQDHFIYIQ